LVISRNSWQDSISQRSSPIIIEDHLISNEVFMNLLKQTAIESIKRLPEGCTVEDIMYRIDLVAQVFEGLRDAEAGRLITTEELLERVDQWAS